MPRFARVLLLVFASAFVVGVSAPPRTASAEAVVDMSVFYDALEPHGTWMHVNPYGWVWQPSGVDVDWRPYVDGGTWIWVEGWGWTWFSEYEWGWAPFHYGRWFFHPAYGWLWVPGPVWAPAWVGWRYGPGWVGWIPLPPEVAYRETIVWNNVDVASPDYTYWWSFVPIRSFTDARLATHRASYAWNPLLVSRTRDVTRFEPGPGRLALVNRSIDVTEFERAGARIERRKLREATVATDSKKEGDAVVLFRPQVTEGRPAKTPKAGKRLDAAAIADRRARLERKLDEEAKALEAKPPEGISPEDVQKSREKVRSDMEEFRRRSREAGKRVEEQPDAPVGPSGKGPPSDRPPGKPEDRPPAVPPDSPPGKPDDRPPGRPVPPPAPERPDAPPTPPGRPPEKPPVPPVPPEQPPKEPPPRDPPGMGDGGMGGGMGGEEEKPRDPEEEPPPEDEKKEKDEKEKDEKEKDEKAKD